MFGQKSRPVIGMLTGSLVSGNRSRLVNVATFPTSHLESKTPSPKGIRTFDVGGVGLGIVAALEKAEDGRSEIPANKALFSWNLSRSNPIPITLCKKSSRNGGSSEHMEGESLEGYSTVTCHVVYCDGRRVNDRSPFRIKTSSIKSNRASVFHISPARFGEDIRVSASNFLSSCHLCQKKLQGKDIYMYRNIGNCLFLVLRKEA